MARIQTVTAHTARGRQRELIEQVKGMYGGLLPDIAQLLLVDPQIAEPLVQLDRHLHLRKASPLTRLERELLATLVHALVGELSCLGLHSEALRRLAPHERRVSPRGPSRITCAAPRSCTRQRSLGHQRVQVRPDDDAVLLAGVSARPKFAVAAASADHCPPTREPVHVSYAAPFAATIPLSDDLCDGYRGTRPSQIATEGSGQAVPLRPALTP